MVIGAGHNGLVSACYLAKQGLNVLVVEKSHLPGGCVRTEELFLGYKVDVYSFEQYLIHSTPIISELELARFGLSYFTVDPVVFAPFRDGKYMVFYRDLEKTIRHIEKKFSQRDAKAYRQLALEFSELNEAIGAMAQSAPISMLDLALSLKDANSDRLFQTIFSSAKDILDERFETDYVKSPIAFLGPAAIGLPPSQKGTGWTVGWHLLARNLARPIGGSGALISALVAMLRSKGGEVLLNSEVSKIRVNDGEATGLELGDGRKFDSDIVIAACDPKQTFLRLVGEEHLDSSLLSSVRAIKVANGLAMKADFALEGQPRYEASPDISGEEILGAATYISPSIESLEKAYDQYKFGRNPTEPGLMVAVHSALDRTLAPKGKHILSLETRYTPYKLSTGEDWDEIKDTIASDLLDLFSEYCPNVRGLVSERYVASPLDWERDLNLPKGNFLHVDMSIDQMFNLRPTAGLGGYRTPIRRLYITGAGTHPGGGVSGMPGYNVARAVMEDLMKMKQKNK